MIRETEFGFVVSANSIGGLFILVDTVRADSISGSASVSTYVNPATVNTYTKFPSTSRTCPAGHRKSFFYRKSDRRTSGLGDSLFQHHLSYSFFIVLPSHVAFRRMKFRMELDSNRHEIFFLRLSLSVSTVAATSVFAFFDKRAKT